MIAAALFALPALAQSNDAATPPAAPPLDSAEALAIDAKMYAAEFGVSFDEALKRMTIMVYGRDATADAALAEGEDLAGRFFENRSSDFGLVVATRKPGRPEKSITFMPSARENYGRLTAAARQARNAQRKAARIAARLNDDEVRKAEDVLSAPLTVKVKYKAAQVHSLAELKAALTRLTSGAATPGLSAVSIDEVGNTLRVFMTAEPAPDAVAKLRATAGVPVVVDVIPGGFMPVANVRGGSKLYNSSTATSTSSRYCMTAFGAKSNTLKNSAGAAMTGMLTAAHCVSQMYAIADDGRIKTLTTPSGHLSDTRGTLNYTDLRFVYSAAGDPVGLGTFYYDGTTNLRAVAGTQSRAGTAVGSGNQYTVTGTAVGSYICHLGQTSSGSTASMQSCGEVISVNASQTSDGSSMNGSGGSFVMVRNTSSGKGTVLGTTGTGTLRCYQSDSGGPWFAGTIAYGVMSSCAWENGIPNSDRVHLALYTSTDYLDRAGVSIIVP